MEILAFLVIYTIILSLLFTYSPGLSILFLVITVFFIIRDEFN